MIMRKRTITLRDKMQNGYRYVLSTPPGRNFDPEFKPELTPAEMLRLGVFGGKYMTDCQREFPKSWFARAKLSPRGRDASLNFFGVGASQPLSEWRRKGWIHPDDPRGWFQWYCRYYMGRRMPGEDARQIALEGDPAPPAANPKALQAGRSVVPAAPAAGAAAPGL